MIFCRVECFIMMRLQDVGRNDVKTNKCWVKFVDEEGPGQVVQIPI